MNRILAAIFVLLFMGAAPINGGLSFPANGPLTPTGAGPGIGTDLDANGQPVFVWFDQNGVKTPFASMIGPQGPPGTAATVAVGSVTSGTPPAVTNSGTANAAILNFVLQPGDKGDPGIQGVQGPPGIVVGSVLTVNITCPKGTGTVGNGWTTTACTLTVTGVR